MNFNFIITYKKIIDILTKNDKDEYRNDIEKRYRGLPSAAEITGEIGIYLLKIKNKDPETYTLIKEPSEEYLLYCASLGMVLE